MCDEGWWWGWDNADADADDNVQDDDLDMDSNIDMEEVHNEEGQGDPSEAQEYWWNKPLEDKEEHGRIVHCKQFRLTNR